MGLRMGWVIEPLFIALAGSLIIVFAYLGICLQERRKYLAFWLAGWALNSIGYLFRIVFALLGGQKIFLMFTDLSALWSGILLLWGTLLFSKRRMDGRWLAVFAGMSLWIIAGVPFHFSGAVTAVPAFFTPALVIILMGLALLRFKGVRGPAKLIAGWTFILWGLHKVDRPFLEPIPWIASLGYIFSAVLSIVSAISIILVYLDKAKRDLQASEQKYRSIFDNAVEGIFQSTFEGMYLSANSAYARMFGYSSPEELMAEVTDIGRQLYVHPENRARFMKTLDDEGFVEGFELKCMRKDGKRIWVSTSARAVRNDAGEALYYEGTVEDITAGKEAEEELLTSQLKLSEAMDLAHIVYWEVDPETREFVFNNSFYAFYGTTAEREGGYRMPREEYSKRFVHPDDMHIFHRVAERRMANKDPEFLDEVEYRIIRRDGEVRHILARIHVSRDATGRVTGHYGANQDITERKKQEEERAKLWSAVERAGEGVFMLTPDRRYSYVNAAFCKAYGFSQEELMGKDTAILRSDVHPPSVHDSLWSELRAGNTWSGRQTRRRKDGALIEVQTTIAPVRDASGAIIHYVGVERDITQQLQLESQLRQAQKMEAIGTLAGGVAHDFNNILTVIMGLGNLLQMSLGPEDRNRPRVDQIVLSSEKAADLTRSLLAFSRKQRIALEPHHVRGVVESTAKLLKRLLPEDIELKLDLADDSAVALLDVSQIEQVLMNLSTNARDAMPHGGSLVIRMERATPDETFRKTRGFGRPGEYVHLSISDTGAGMDEKTMARIFDPFFTTKEVGKGTGLGLASAYGIVKQHNGYITVTSVLLKGTTFDIYLPLVEVAVGNRPAANAEVIGGSETVLVIEDDADVRNMVIDVLSTHGYTLLEAANGDDAIRIFKERKDAISLIILDVVMPERTGKEVLDEIIRIDPGVKAIFMSGYTGDIVIDKGVQKDSVDFLQKPLSVPKLLGKVREVLDR